MERREGIFGGVNVALLRSEPATRGRAIEGIKPRRGSGRGGLRGQVEGGRWKRGLSLFHWASGLKVTG